MSAFVWPFVILAFSTWAVSLGGIASLQVQCVDGPNGITVQLASINGFSGDPSGSFYMTCNTVYRFHWFIVALEFAVLLISAGFLASGFIRRARMSMIGLLSIVTLLYISMTDTFLSAGSIPDFYSGNARTRARVMLAGSLMTAAANCFLIIAGGIDMDGFKGLFVEEVIVETAEKAAV